MSSLFDRIQRSIDGGHVTTAAAAAAAAAAVVASGARMYRRCMTADVQQSAVKRDA